jgi:mycofactocin precursor
MPDPTAAPTIDEQAEAVDAQPAEDDLVAGELLVEDVSIDGMCGVY